MLEPNSCSLATHKLRKAVVDIGLGAVSESEHDAVITHVPSASGQLPEAFFKLRDLKLDHSKLWVLFSQHTHGIRTAACTLPMPHYIAVLAFTPIPVNQMNSFWSGSEWALLSDPLVLQQLRPVSLLDRWQHMWSSCREWLGC